jgi:hypothetical protein
MADLKDSFDGTLRPCTPTARWCVQANDGVGVAREPGRTRPASSFCSPPVDHVVEAFQLAIEFRLRAVVDLEPLDVLQSLGFSNVADDLSQEGTKESASNCPGGFDER